MPSDSPRSYTDEEAARAVAMLKANGGNAKKTARQLGIPRTTLRAWVGRADVGEGSKPKTVPQPAIDAAQAKLGDQWEEIAILATKKGLEAIRGLSPKHMKMNDVYSLLKGGGVATDKVQLLRGLPTSREGREVRIIFSADSGAGSLRELAERTMSGTPALPEPPLEGEVVATQD